jgi:hypothetical protein
VPHIVHDVKCFAPMGMMGMKNRLKYRRIRVSACAEGVRQYPHIAKMVANLDDLRRNPKRTITATPRSQIVSLPDRDQWCATVDTGVTTPPQRQPNSRAWSSLCYGRCEVVLSTHSR